MPNKERILKAQLNERQKREIEVASQLRSLPLEGRREFLLREFSKEPVTRSFEIEARNFDDETQSFDFAFSSEYPVERWGAVEILIHTPDAVDLGRLNDGGAFCVNHDTRGGQVGVHERAWIDGQDKKCRGRARLSKNNPRAVQEYLDVKDGIRRHISTTYWIHDLVIYQFNDKPDEIHITRWEPLENSTVAIPADPTVGIGRGLSLEHEAAEQPDKETRTMPNEVKNQPSAGTDLEEVRSEARSEGELAGKEAGRKAAESRVNEMLAIGKKWGDLELAYEHLRNGGTPQGLLDAILEKRNTTPPAPAEEVGLSRNEVARFRLIKLFRHMAEPNNVRAREAAAFELEACSAARALRDTDGHGTPLPWEVMRSQLIATDDTGGFFVPTTQYPSIIEQMVNSMKAFELGAQPFGNLKGKFDIPTDEGGIDAYVVGEDEAPTPSTAKFGMLNMAARTIAASGYIPRTMANQTSFDVEVWLRKKLAQRHALKMDYLCFFGNGGKHEPVGLFNHPDVQIVAIDTNGGAPTRDLAVDLHTKVDVGNALMGKLAFLTTSKVRGKLMKTPEHATANVGGWVWQKGDKPAVGDLIGYPAHVSNQLPDTLTKGSSSGICSPMAFGDWDQLAIAMFGPFELTVDPYTSSSKGGTWLHSFSDFDSGVLRSESFALCKDILTT